MSGILAKLLRSESGQSATEYMLFLVLAVTLALIGFLVVPYFSEGFNVLLSRILGGGYYGSVY